MKHKRKFRHIIFSIILYLTNTSQFFLTYRDAIWEDYILNSYPETKVHQYNHKALAEEYTRCITQIERGTRLFLVIYEQ